MLYQSQYKSSLVSECACSGVVNLVYRLGRLSQNFILFKDPLLFRCFEAQYF